MRSAALWFRCRVAPGLLLDGVPSRRTRGGGGKGARPGMRMWVAVPNAQKRKPHSKRSLGRAVHIPGRARTDRLRFLRAGREGHTDPNPLTGSVMLTFTTMQQPSPARQFNSGLLNSNGPQTVPKKNCWLSLPWGGLSATCQGERIPPQPPKLR